MISLCPDVHVCGDGVLDLRGGMRCRSGNDDISPDVCRVVPAAELR
jgi:hypothetical protein